MQPDTAVQFTITFQPTARGSASGSLSIAFAGASAVNIQLSGQATGANLTYTLTVGSQSSTLAAGATLSLPSTNVGSSVTAAITVVNGGDAAANIGAVTVVGAGYSVTNVPPTPATVSAGGSFTFTLVFSPQVSGTASGTLLIGAVSFPLSSVGLGASLTYSSLIGSATASIANGGTVVFPNTNLGSSTTISHPGCQYRQHGRHHRRHQHHRSRLCAGRIFRVFRRRSIPAPACSSALCLRPPRPPPLPARCKSTLSASVCAAWPTSRRPSAGWCSAACPPTPLPCSSRPSRWRFPSPTRCRSAGTLTLTFVSNSFADDPNIQFASGGRTASFTVPPNTVNAVFGSTPQVQFQTGTVAGVITLTASLSVASASVTPNPAPAVQVTIPASAPVISNVQLGATTANSFELLITGLSTTRDVASLNLQFTPASGAQLQTTTLTVNSEGAFNTWFQSQTGISFGSQFTASVIVNVNGNGNAMQSVAVTASNSQGQSAPASLSLSLN